MEKPAPKCLGTGFLLLGRVFCCFFGERGESGIGELGLEVAGVSVGFFLWGKSEREWGVRGIEVYKIGKNSARS